MAHAKLQLVRERFAYQCGYCGVHESDTGAELTVDHYRPTTVGGDESDENLVYCCFKCNQFKGDFWPGSEDLALGRRVLHPLLDDFPRHFQEESAGELVPRTETGRFHIALLHLNRPALVAYRLQRRVFALLTVKTRVLETENAQLRATIVAQGVYVEALRKLLSPSPEE